MRSFSTHFFVYNKIYHIFASKNIEMRKIANIVGGKVPNDKNYNMISDVNEIDATLPTLFIGLENARENIEGFTILDKSYPSQNKWWTFKKTERRADYEVDIEKFHKFAIQQIVNNVKYEFINIITYSWSRFKKCHAFLFGNNKKYIYFHPNKNFLFIYSPKYNIVWGLSLTLTDYMNVNREKLIERFRKQPNNIFIHKIPFFDDSIKQTIKDNIHYIPILYDYFLSE